MNDDLKTEKITQKLATQRLAAFQWLAGMFGDALRNRYSPHLFAMRLSSRYVPTGRDSPYR